jgi:endonuclease-3
MNRMLRRLYPEARLALRFTTDFECLVAVQLSAQCTDARVNQVTPALFAMYPTVDAFASARQRDVERLIYSCGFYRNKAKNIIAAARTVRDRFDGEVPSTLAELITIPGVARKTANVALSTLFGRHEGVAVDTHVRRFAIRFDLTDHSDPVRIERDLMELMPREEWWGFNHRLVCYGREYCGARPHDCGEHPLTKVYPPAADYWPRAL